VLAAGLVLGGCARPGSPGTGPADPDSPVTGSPGTGSPGPSPSPDLLEPRAGLVDLRPHPWDEAVPLRPAELLVTFYGGVEECYGLDRVEVEERRKTVTITLFTGRVPQAEVCIEIAVYQGVVVTLDEPVGDRTIRDGAP
jgi:hypothetical protein